MAKPRTQDHATPGVEEVGMYATRSEDRGTPSKRHGHQNEVHHTERKNVRPIQSMNEQHQNVAAFVNQYTASMSKEQHRAFWKKFRKAANAYAETQAERITKLEEENNRLKSTLKEIQS